MRHLCITIYYLIWDCRTQLSCKKFLKIKVHTRFLKVEMTHSFLQFSLHYLKHIKQVKTILCIESKIMQFYQIWASQEWKEEITQDLTWPIEVFVSVYTAGAAWQKMSTQTPNQPGEFIIANVCLNFSLGFIMLKFLPLNLNCLTPHPDKFLSAHICQPLSLVFKNSI